MSYRAEAASNIQALLEKHMPAVEKMRDYGDITIPTRKPGRPKLIVPPRTLQAMICDYSAGASYKAVAEKYGMAETTAKSLLRGKVKSWKSGRRRTVSKESVAAMALDLKHMTTGEVAKKYFVSDWVVRYYTRGIVKHRRTGARPALNKLHDYICASITSANKFCPGSVKHLEQACRVLEKTMLDNGHARASSGGLC